MQGCTLFALRVASAEACGKLLLHWDQWGPMLVQEGGKLCSLYYLPRLGPPLEFYMQESLQNAF